MKLTQIIMQDSAFETFCTLGFRDPTTQNPYIMKAISGLDAPEIVPRFYGLGDTSRQKFYNMTTPSRQVVFRIGLNPDFISGQSFSDLRDTIYRKLVSSRSGTFTVYFMDGATFPGDVIAGLHCLVTKVEAPLSDIPEIQITANCVTPTIYGTRTTLGVMPAVGDPLVIDDDMSTAPHAFYTQIHVITPFLTMEILGDSGDSYFKLTPDVIGADTGFLADDIIYISGEPQVGKSVTMDRGVDTGILIADKIQPGSLWPVVFPGSNSYTLETIGGTAEFQEVTWSPAYWGI